MTPLYNDGSYNERELLRQWRERVKWEETEKAGDEDAWLTGPEEPGIDYDMLDDIAEADCYCEACVEWWGDMDRTSDFWKMRWIVRD